MTQKKTTEKIRHALRPDKALRFVWTASPLTALVNLSLIAIQGVLPVLSLFLMKVIVDNVSIALTLKDPLMGLQPVLVPVCIAGGVALLTEMVQEGIGLVKDVQAIRVTDHVYDLLHEKSAALDLAYYENPEYYDTLHRAQQEGPYRPARIVDELTNLLQNGISLAAVMGLMMTFHWGLALILFAAVSPGIIVRVIHSTKMYNWQTKRIRAEREAEYFSYMLTGEPHAKEVRIFSLGTYFISRFSSLRKVLRREKTALIYQRGLGDFFAQSIAVFGVFGALAFMTVKCLKGMMTIGALVMYFQAFQKGFGYLKACFDSLAGLYEDNLFVSVFYEFLDMESLVVDKANPLPSPNSLTEGIVFDHVTFRYPHGDHVVLDDITFQVRPGEVIALVGENGSGKTTLIKLLSRLYDPCEGMIRIDGNDIRDYSIEGLRGIISVVFQDYMKYQLTVKDNIALGDTRTLVNNERVRRAASFANARDMIEKLPDKYDTILGKWLDDGEELSAGQWQKIALARAFYRKSPVIVLDEPTSALDPNSEYQVFLTFRQLIEKRTAFLISHRFSTVKMADRIFVMADGRIIESGTHDELIALGQMYCKMYNQQAGNYQ